MSVVQPLLELQEIDGRIRSLQQEIRDIPQRKAQELERLSGAKEVLERAKAEHKNALVRVSELDLEVKARKEKILSLKQNQVSLKTNKEFQMFNLEIAKIEGDIDSFEARQIAALDDVIPIKHRVAEAEAKLKAEQAVMDVYLTELDVRLAAVQAELAEVEAARVEAAKRVSAPFAQYYERLRSKRWPVVVDLQADGVCNGCHLKQPPSVAQQVRRNQGLVTCQMCGRILYML